MNVLIHFSLSSEILFKTRTGPWGVQEALPNRASKNYEPQKNYNTHAHLN